MRRMQGDSVAAVASMARLRAIDRIVSDLHRPNDVAGTAICTSLSRADADGVARRAASLPTANRALRSLKMDSGQM